MAPLLRNDPVGQTIDKMNELLKEKYEEKKENAKAAGRSLSEAPQKTFAAVPGREGLARYKHRDKTEKGLG